MNILLIYPQFPDTFWSFSYALRFIGKKSAFPPLGLITVAALIRLFNLEQLRPVVVRRGGRLLICRLGLGVDFPRLLRILALAHKRLGGELHDLALSREVDRDGRGVGRT